MNRNILEEQLKYIIIDPQELMSPIKRGVRNYIII